jgi:serine protease AprX
MTRHRTAVVALAAAALLAVTGAAPALATAPAPAATAAATGGTATSRYLVALADPDADPAVGARVADVLRAGDGRLLAVHESVGTIVVEVSPAVAAGLAGVAGVRSVTPDGVAHVQSLGYSPSTQSGSMTNVTRLTGAQGAWRKGITGAGVDVAVIDTGTAPVASLKHSTKVVAGPDLSFESQALNLRYLDGYGHGTHMASIIAGREVAPAAGSVYAADTKNLYGMAPDARIISVKVGDHDGAVDVSQLIAAIDWVVQNRQSHGLNVRVLNLSFGTDSRQSYLLDPLSYAAETAWRSGIFVVASAGNDGSQASGLADPAYNPNLFAVGAVDTRGTDVMTDDVVPDFSQHPNSTQYLREPDVVAPGVGIVAAGVPGASLWTSYPGARLGADQFRGSGTSQAAAVVSGAAALLLQRWPDASPDAVRDLLTRTATPLRGTPTALQGRGELNVTAALASAPAAPATLEALLGAVRSTAMRANGLGSLEAARGSSHVVMDGVTLAGERDIMGASWIALLTSGLTRDLRMWSSGGVFNGNQWIGDGFTIDTTTAAGLAWGGRSWAGRSWAGRSWAGSAWSGRSWAGVNWNGRSWAGGSWTSSTTWSANTFTGSAAGRPGSGPGASGRQELGPPAMARASIVSRHWGSAGWR